MRTRTKPAAVGVHGLKPIKAETAIAVLGYTSLIASQNTAHPIDVG
jgi:hypothetical protein